MQPHRTCLRVRYAETDQMGIVHHANYLVWLEAARVEFARASGFNYRDMELEDGVMMVVAEVKLRYAAPARFDDEIVIHTWIAEAGPRLVRFEYEILGPGGRKLVAAETKHIFCGRNLKPCRVPEKYRPCFGL
jgi:acyl-CoA thioester hydrolase